MKQKTQIENFRKRRTVLKGVALGAIAISITSWRAKRADAAMPALDEKDPQARALGYVTDAGRVDVKSDPTFKPGQSCANCLQLQGKPGDALRSCNLFPGKLVNVNGWCKAWVKKG